MKQLAAGGAKRQLVFSYNIELEEESSLIYLRIRWRKIEVLLILLFQWDTELELVEGQYLVEGLIWFEPFRAFSLFV